jgi:integrase
MFTRTLLSSLKYTTFGELRSGTAATDYLYTGQRTGLDRLDPPVTVTPHTLRHTYAYMLRKAGVSVEVRAEMSGHSIETAMKYGSPKAREKERAAVGAIKASSCA